MSDSEEEDYEVSDADDESDDSTLGLEVENFIKKLDFDQVWPKPKAEKEIKKNVPKLVKKEKNSLSSRLSDAESVSFKEKQKLKSIYQKNKMNQELLEPNCDNVCTSMSNIPRPILSNSDKSRTNDLEMKSTNQQAVLPKIASIASNPNSKNKSTGNTDKKLNFSAKRFDFQSSLPVENLSSNTNLQVKPKSNLKFDATELKLILNSESSVTPNEKMKNTKNKTKSKINVLNQKKMKPTPVQSCPAKSKSSQNEMDISLYKTKKELKSSTIKEKENTSELNSLKDKLKAQLQSASFRILNEKLYTGSGSDGYQMFRDDPEAYKIYHKGYSTQMSQWPVNPLSIIISWLRKKPRNWVVADFGCGDATLSKSIKQKTLSLDLVRSRPDVIECDMAHTPLESSSVDVVVFCLSLMGTNLTEFILEANRVLVQRGVLKVAEVESRFADVNEFTKRMSKLGFKCIHKDANRKFFWLFDFIKVKDVKPTMNKIELKLKPCLYKKR